MQVNISKKIIVYYTLLIAWMTFIFFMSSQIATTSSGMSRIFVEPIQPYATGFAEDILTTLVRKSAHIFMYFVLGMLIFNVLKEYKLGTKQLVGFSILFAGLYAITDEIHQTFVSGRSAEVRDVLIDTMGASIGVVLYWAILKIIKKRRSTVNAKY